MCGCELIFWMLAMLLWIKDYDERPHAQRFARIGLITLCVGLAAIPILVFVKILLRS
jgi:hypothetical protein